MNLLNEYSKGEFMDILSSFERDKDRGLDR